MKYLKDSYRFRFEDSGATRHIHAQFIDTLGRPREAEVSKEVFRELGSINRSIRSMERSDLRHIDRRALDDEELAVLTGRLSPSAEDIALRNLSHERLKASFLELSPLQARRFLLVYGLGFSYAETARIEGCSINAIKHSLAFARRNLQRILQKRLPDIPC